MMTLTMTLQSENWQEGSSVGLPRGHHVIWIMAGSVERAGETITANSGLYADDNGIPLSVSENNAELLRFSLTREVSHDDAKPTDAATSDLPASCEHSETLLQKTFTTSHTSGVLRLDSVCFPPGVRAYRHIHAGPGIRYLTHGSLTLQSDTHTQKMLTGESWFEDSSTPVQATGSTGETSGFVRALYLPTEYHGKPTIKLLNAGDEDKPKLQTNTRYVDQLITF